MARTMTEKQERRQMARSHETGRYQTVNPCELCGRSCGVDGPWYTAGATGDGLRGRGITLHARCLEKLQALGDEEAQHQALLDAAAKRER